MTQRPGVPCRIFSGAHCVGQAERNPVHPLHYVSDMLFGGVLARGRELPLIDALLQAGADCNCREPNGETPLIGAASLTAEDACLRLLAAGADPNARGAGRETALHWAAATGLDRLAAALIERGAEVDLKDARYQSTPLGWAIHCRAWLADEKVAADTALLAALRRY